MEYDYLSGANNISYILRSVENKTLSLDDFLLPNHLRVIIENSISKPIKKGGIGSIYDLPYANIVVKITNPCENDVPLHRLLCNVTKEKDAVFLIPQYGKDLYLIPNDLSEGVISGLLSTETMFNLSPHFSKTLGTFYSPREHKYYTFMEKYQDTYPLNDIRDAYYILFQVAHGLLTAQELHQFTHYDLHTGNILFKANDEEYLHYNVKTGGNKSRNYILFNDNRLITKIIDFGFSRAAIGDIVINPRVDLNIQGHRSFGSFNPLYDFTAFLGHILQSGIRRDKKFPLGIQLYDLLSTDIEKILLFLYNNESLDITELYMKNVKDQTIWRPHYYTKYHNNARSMTHLVNLLSLILKKYGLMEEFDPTAYITREFPSVPDISETLDETNYLNYGPFKYLVRTFVNQTNKWVIKHGYPSYIHTPTEESLSRVFPKHVFHIFLIDTERAAHDGYELKTSCCKLDPKIFMQNKRGLAINGAFYDILKSYLPVGPYRSEEFSVNKHPIPKTYANDYGVISIHNNNIFIESLNDLEQQTDSDYFVSGPLLVDNYRRVVTDDTLYTVKDNKYIYQCRVAEKDEDSDSPFFSESKITTDKVIFNKQTKKYKRVSKTDKTDIDIPNCSKIKAGELSHIANPNPRSMLVIRDNADGMGDLAFVTVEGRGSRGDGADLSFLSYIATLDPINAITAINLDGGRSSILAWNFDGTVYTQNPTMMDDYVVGNIIAFVK
jgi:hypothetical protein